MAGADDLLVMLRKELLRLMRPLLIARDDPEARKRLFNAIGWDLAAVEGFPIDALVADLDQLAQIMQTLVEEEPDAAESLADIALGLIAVSRAFVVLDGLSRHAGHTSLDVPGEVATALAELGEDVLNFLFVTYLERYHPVAGNLARLLTLIETPADANAPIDALPKPGGGGPYRRRTSLPRARFDRIGTLLSDPLGTLRTIYLPPGGLADEDAVRESIAPLLDRIATLLMSLGLAVSEGSGIAGHETRDARRTLALEFMFPVDGSMAAIGAVATVLADSEGGAGVTIAPFGVVNGQFGSGDWTFAVQSSGTLPSVTLRADGPELPSNIGAYALALTVARRSRASQPAMVFGAAGGTRLELGGLAAKFGVALAAARQEFEIDIDISNSALIFQASEGDGFLRDVLPPGGIRADFDTGLTWSRTRGLRLRGAVGMAFDIPLNIDLLGILFIDRLSVFMKANAGGASPGVQAGLGVTVEIAIGPVHAAIERMGLRADLTFPPSGSNLGVADLDVAFLPPRGVGLSIDAGPVSGGGYLFFDPDEALYAGAVQLSMKALSFNAVGVVTTRLPDGGDGFSMLLIITAEFPPIQLGFGFSLIGIGGLAGIHRDMDPDALGHCLREGRLGSILFPRDVVANVRRIVDDIRTVFPPQRDRHVFGPMVKIGWGANALLEMDVAVLIALPSPILIAILGRMRAALPTRDDPVVDLRLEVLGLIDLGRGRITVEARLVDSRIAAFAVTGGMAMLISWGATKAFVLSVGGFNPRFLPPPDFHAPARLGIALSSGENPTFTLTSYFALTSNAVQFGAGADFRLAVETMLGVFSVEAYAQFDVLLIFDPPFFAADLRAGIAIKRNGAVLFLARLEASLLGPEPWRINGFVEVQLLVPLHIPFSATLGEPAAETPPASLPRSALQARLAEEILRAENWAALPQAQAEAVVSLRRVEPLPGTVLVHPLGGLGFRQRLLPLNKALRRFGTAQVSDPGGFAIGGLRLGGAAVAARPVEDDFAPGEFESLSDDEKLTRPAFESLPAGVEATPAGLWLPQTLRAPVTGHFEETVMRADGTTHGRTSTLPGLGFVQADTRRFGDAGIAAIAVRPERYVLAEPDTLQTFPGGEAAHAVLADARRGGGTQVLVPAHEAIVVVDP